MLAVTLTCEDKTCGQAYFKPHSLLGFRIETPSIISITHNFYPERQRVEAFIEKIFAKNYGAHISKHYPTLMSVRNREGEILAAVGFRMAAQFPLFLEQYLEQPIEDEISMAAGQEVNRPMIAEVGSLASTGSGASIYLYLMLVDYLRRHNIRYPVATLTKSLTRTFQRFGIETHNLGIAQASALNAEEAQHWGSYYDTDPHVLTASIRSVEENLAHYLPQYSAGTFFPRLHY